MSTWAERASSVALMLAFVLAPPEPDGTIDVGDQQHIAFSFAGVVAGAPVPEVVPELGVYITVDSVDRWVTPESVDRWIVVEGR